MNHRVTESSVPLWFILAAGFALRLPLLRESALPLGWNSDAAIFGLMARAIRAGTDFPIFYWGQSYMGPLTSYLAAGLSLFTGDAGPLALRLSSTLLILGGVGFFWAALRRLFAWPVAAAVALWMAIGPGYLFEASVAPIGAEQMFFLSGVIFWHCVRTELVRVRDWFVFGLLSGFGWWINQGVVFVVGAALLIAVLRSEWWRLAWPRPELLDRLFMRTTQLGWRPVGRATTLLLRGVNALLLIAIALGVMRSFGVRVPAVFLYHPLLEPLIVFVVFRLSVAAVLNRTSVSLWFQRMLTTETRRFLPFVLGAFIGYAPVLIAERLGRVPEKYGLSVPPLDLSEVGSHFRTFVTEEFWKLIGADDGRWLIAIVIVPALLAAMWRRRKRIAALVMLTPASYGGRAMAAVTVLLCIIFYMGSQRAHPGSARYIASALPMVYAFAVEELFRWRRTVAYAAVVVVAALLLVARTGDAQRVADGHAERYGRFPGGFDPLPVLARIESSGYRVCYADYWVAYKLQWVSAERVKFIPFHSYDRTPQQSAQLAALPEPKCFVDGNGRVTRFVPGDEGTSRAARERLRRGRPPL